MCIGIMHFLFDWRPGLEKFSGSGKKILLARFPEKEFKNPNYFYQRVPNRIVFTGNAQNTRKTKGFRQVGGVCCVSAPQNLLFLKLFEGLYPARLLYVLRLRTFKTQRFQRFFKNRFQQTLRFPMFLKHFEENIANRNILVKIFPVPGGPRRNLKIFSLKIFN